MLIRQANLVMKLCFICPFEKGLLGLPLLLYRLTFTHHI